MSPGQSEAVSLHARLGVVAGMCALAVLVSSLTGPNPSLTGVLISVVAAPIFPVGLVYLVRAPGSGGGVTDVALLLACAFPYVLYAGVLTLAVKVKSIGGFLLVCLLLAVLLSLNVKGCETGGHTRWVSS